MRAQAVLRLLGPTTALIIAAGAASLAAGGVACNSGALDAALDGAVHSDGAADAQLPECIGGVDKDGDRYGLGCPAGNDCDDSLPSVHPGARELCDGLDNDCDGTADEGVLNACGTCSGGCNRLGEGPFPLDPSQDPSVKKADGIGHSPDGKGDLVLDETKTDFNYMWIANTADGAGRGTISKIDTVSMKEVARYYTITCSSKPGATGCVDVHGKAIAKAAVHSPSRTAVDYNFDVWVANRAFKGQASATKIANEVSDCVDRNNDGKIDTSKDHDADGSITLDCDGDGVPDGAATTCAGAHAGQPPEFVGYDDECVLRTVTYGDTDDIGRSICLDGGIDMGASNAWVGTYGRATNRFYRIRGTDGALTGPFDLPAGHRAYGCAVDAQRILWSVDLNGSLTYLNTLDPKQVGPALEHPFGGSKGFYGISVDGNQHIWLGGWVSKRIYRYEPDRTSFATLGGGTWTGIIQPSAFDTTRGIAADNRGKVWVAVTKGYLWRVDQQIGQGLQDLSGDTNYWQTAGSKVIGAGVDFKGHIWGIAHDGDLAVRLDVDPQGNVIEPPTATTNKVPVGKNPYTYSDFTGFGLKSFVRPRGTYVVQLQPCSGTVAARWDEVSWDADVPPNTAIELRVRSGDSPTGLGAWHGPYQQSPAVLGSTAANPLQPNPARILELEFVLRSGDKQTSPTLKSFAVSYSCDKKPG